LTVILPCILDQLDELRGQRRPQNYEGGGGGSQEEEETETTPVEEEEEEQPIINHEKHKKWPVSSEIRRGE